MNNKSNFLIRGLLVAVGLGLAAAQARAGTIVGKISDINTGASVAGATVTDVKTGQSVNADREGQFRLNNIAPGEVELQISSMGYDNQTQAVEVPETGNASAQILLGTKVLKLEKLVVEGYREGWAKAQQQKRNSLNMKEVLSSDAAGKLPDNNVGEALARLPGVSLDVDYGEGHYVSIRGTDPNLNTVTMNGATLATPAELGRTGRSSPMDMLGTGLVSQIEVIKTLTPDMDGTSLGGTINILTPSGFDHKGRFISGAIQYGENQAGHEPIYAADFGYTNVFGKEDKQLGVAFTANFEKRNTRRDMYMNTWAGNASQPVLTEPRLDYSIDEREQKGLALNLDYRVSNGARIYFHGFYNKFDETNDKNEQLYTSIGAATQLTPTQASFPSIRYDLRMISFVRESEMTNLIFGGSKVFGDYKFSAEATYSNAPDQQPEYRNFSFRSGTVPVPGGYVIDYSSPFATFDVTNQVATANPNARQVRGDTIDNSEKTSTVKVDLEKNSTNLIGGKSGYIKIGGKYTDRHRSAVRHVGIYTAPGLKMSDFDPGITTPRPLTVMDGIYVMPNSIDPATSRANFASYLQQGKLVLDQNASLSNQGEDTYDVVEQVASGYAMASVDITKELTLFGGFRYEDTHAPLSGPNFSTSPAGLPVVVNKTVTYDYGEFLPNLQLRYKVGTSTYIRAGITKTFGRPAYGDQVPKSTLDNSGGVLTTGNPNLQPFESLNYDASIEHYFKSGGIISVGAFYKTIDNPIYTYSTIDTNVTYAGYFFPVFTTSSKENGESATLKGLEVSMQLPFSAFVHGFVDGFGVDLNASFMDSSVTVFTRPGEDLPLFESPKRIFNAGLYYEKYGVSARLAYNYKSDSLQSIGANPYTDIYNSSRYFWDAQVGYKISENYSAFLNWQNITDEKVNSYTASSKDHIFQSYWFGSNIRAGVRFRF